MGESRSSRSYSSLPLAIVSIYGLMFFVVMVGEVLAGHALGFDSQTAWRAQLQRVDAALARNDLAGAEMLWRKAFAAALKSRHWEGMVAVGDAYRRLGERAGFGNVSEGKAREMYRTALFRARSEGSVEGVLRAAQGFAELGDSAAVEQCIHVARGVAAQARDPRDEERIRGFAERWAARVPEVDLSGLIR